MRILSQYGTCDFPYDSIALSTGYSGDKTRWYIFANHVNCEQKPQIIATYSSEAKAEKAMEMVRIAYAGRFVTNADVPDDFNEQLKELMKGGFGTVIVKDTSDSRVKFNNLNGYFQFPQDEDLEVQC